METAEITTESVQKRLVAAVREAVADSVGDEMRAIKTMVRSLLDVIEITQKAQNLKLGALLGASSKRKDQGVVLETTDVEEALAAAKKLKGPSATAG